MHSSSSRSSDIGTRQPYGYFDLDGQPTRTVDDERTTLSAVAGPSVFTSVNFTPTISMLLA